MKSLALASGIVGKSRRVQDRPSFSWRVRSCHEVKIYRLWERFKGRNELRPLSDEYRDKRVFFID